MNESSWNITLPSVSRNGGPSPTYAGGWLVSGCSVAAVAIVRARKEQDITEMLIAGELDAAVYGAALPKDQRLQSVIPDPKSAAHNWYRKPASFR